jgi:hypothetical protein
VCYTLLLVFHSPLRRFFCGLDCQIEKVVTGVRNRVSRITNHVSRITKQVSSMGIGKRREVKGKRIQTSDVSYRLSAIGIQPKLAERLYLVFCIMYYAGNASRK